MPFPDFADGLVPIGPAHSGHRHALFGHLTRVGADEEVEEYHARWEAVETVKAQELAALTEERVREMILSLGAVEAWRDRPDWSGLVEQQAIFQRGVAK